MKEKEMGLGCGTEKKLKGGGERLIVAAMKTTWVLLVWILVIGTAAGAEGFKLPKQYSAEQEIKADGMDIKAKLYVDGDKWRVDAVSGSNEIVTIFRKDKKVVITLFPSIKAYKIDIMSAEQANQKGWQNDRAQWVKIGEETIRDTPCLKYKVTVDDSSSLVWISTKDKIPLRVQAENVNAIMEMSNFKKDKPAAALFEIPGDYAPAQNFVGQPPGEPEKAR